MKASSYFYCDIEYSQGQEPLWLQQLNDYSATEHKRVYIQRFPVTDTENPEYDSNFLLMVAGSKLCMVQQSDDDTFNYYKEDIEGSISYLYRNFNYRPVLGPYSKICETLLDTANESELDNVPSLLAKLQLTNELDKRHSELLIALCIGSPNEIDRVGNEVPQTLLEKVKHKIQLFDGDQTRFIYQSQKQNNKPVIKIQGLSGTGKTELLLHKIKELYLAKEQYKIFFTCHNKILATTLHDRLEKFFDDMKVNKQIAWEKRLWCTNAWGRSYDPDTGFYSYICHHYGIVFQSYTYGTSFNTLCKAALQTLNEMTDFTPCFDYVIVDESQDFDEPFFELCQKVASKKVYLAGDIFQSIFAEHIENSYKADYLLGKCYRTAPDTLLFAHALGLGLFEQQRYRWLSDADWETCGYNVQKNATTLTLSREPANRFDGDDEEYESISFYGTSDDDFAKKMCVLIKKIQEETQGKVEPDDIAVIFIDDNKKIYNRANRLDVAVQTILGWEVNKAYESKEKEEGKLFVSNRYNSKGLEFPYVICVTDGIQNDYHYRNSIYTMLTRSFIKSYLVVCGDAPIIPAEIRRGWEQIKTEHRMTITIPTKEEQLEIEFKFTEAKKALSLRERVELYAKANNMSDENREKLIGIMNNANLESLDEDQVNDMIDQAASLLVLRKK